jgi:hypothetical protein
MTALSVLQAQVVAKAVSLLGTPYVYGVTDCEWLTRVCALAIGVTIPWGSSEQWDAPGLQAVKFTHQHSLWYPGDLLYFQGSDSPGPGQPGHCGVNIGGGHMIDAPYTGVNVRVDSWSPTTTTGDLAFYGGIRVALLVATPDPTESDDDMAKIFVAQGSTAPYLVGGVPVQKEYLVNRVCEALLGLGYPITRDVNPAYLAAIPNVPNAASPTAVLPVAQPPVK